MVLLFYGDGQSHKKRKERKYCNVLLSCFMTAEFNCK